MSDKQKCCGTCRWFEFRGTGSMMFITRGAGFGACHAPQPDSDMTRSRKYMLDNEGTTCPTWAAREDDR